MKVLMLAVVTATVAAAAAAEIAPEDRRSGYDFAGPDTRAMQDNDTANPGMLGVLQGETLWASKAGATNLSCADCHGDPRTSMKGVAARYPAFEPALVRPLDLEGRINRCRTEHQVAEPFA
jgi:sulfur-oxidizing protein SoxA